MPVTIRDIARRAGVSVSTASRALNKRGDVSREARERVLGSARDLDYAVNLHARALTGATSKMLGFILYDSATTFHALMARGVEEVATARGYSLVVCNTGGAREPELRAHQMILEKRVDGVLINSIQSGDAPLRRLAAEGIPFVLLNRRSATVPSDHVVVDFRRGAYMATMHLLSLGHRRIMYQVAQPDHPPVLERVAGYRQALEEYGAPFDSSLVVHCGGRLECAYDIVIEAMHRQSNLPTALLAYNDQWAIPLYKALHDLALRIPDDVAVIGHNDLEFAPYLLPPLSSVSIPVLEMGRMGAQILFDRLDWPEDREWEVRQTTLAPTLIARESTAARIVQAAPLA